jgi:hypothetical protein
MTVAWIGVGTALLGAGASYAGSKKQADAAKKGSKLQMDQFNTLNRQQQPFIQSGYGAMGKLNTLLGIGGGQGGFGGRMPMQPQQGANVGQMYRPQPNGGMQQIVSGAPQTMGAPPTSQNMRLKKILMLRAQNGDTQAAQMLEQV